MPEKHAAVPRRVIRRRHRIAGAAWYSSVRINPRRLPLHLLTLSLGASVVAATMFVNRPSPAPADPDAPPALVAEQSAADEEAVEPETVAPALAAPAEAAPELKTYVVEPGDSLRTVAQQFGVSVATIAAANKLANPDLIAVGQELVIPSTSGLLTTLSPGETLGQLAERYGVDVPTLATANRLAPLAEQPVLGSKLVVPGVEPQIAEASKPESKPQASDAVAEAKPDSQASRGLASLTITGEEGEDKQVSGVATEQPAAKPKSPVSYEVQEGDTVRALANQFGVSIKTILLANDLADPDLIKPGMELRVLPVSGVEHAIAKGESLADIAAAYKVDLGPIVDFNGLDDPDTIRVGDKVIIPGATALVTTAAAAAPAASEPRITPQSPASAVAALPPTNSSSSAAVRPSAPAAAAAPAPARAASAAAAPAAPARVAVPAPVAGGGGGGVVKNAMAYQGYRYVFGGSSPSGFDCSGFVWYVHKIAGESVSRGLWGQLNGGPRISRENLQAGDTVFFANTYMPGLSHVGIYIGGGSFIHAIDESSGVGISNMSSGYWAPRYIGAARLHQ